MQSIDNQQYRVSQTEKYQHESSDLSIHDIFEFSSFLYSGSGNPTSDDTSKRTV